MSLAKRFDDTQKTQRLYARATPRQKELIQQAADIKGQSLTDFVMTNLEKVAEETVSNAQIIRLNAQDSQKLVRLLLNPPKPSDNLIQAAQRYQDLNQSQ